MGVAGLPRPADQPGPRMGCRPKPLRALTTAGACGLGYNGRMPPTPQTVAKFPVWSVLIKHARRWAEPFGIEARAHHSSPKVLAEFTGEPRYAIDLVHIDPDTDQVLALATVSVCV